MYVPPGYTEKEVLDIITKVAMTIAPKYKFGYMKEDDMVQQAIVIILSSGILEKFKPGNKLENFLAASLRNRLLNFKRDNYIKPDPPCIRCPLKAFLPPDGCSAYKDKMDCKFYAKWVQLNENRKNISHTINLDGVTPDGEKNMSYNNDIYEQLDKDLISKKILRKISAKNRKLYIKLINKCFIPKADREALAIAIQEIIHAKD